MSHSDFRTLESADLLAALDTNMVGFWKPYGRGVGCKMQDAADAVWIYTGVPHPLFNCVIRASLPPNGIEATRNTLQGLIRERGAPVLWWVGPLSQPSDLGAALERSGLSAAGEAPGMAIDLAALPAESEAIANFSVETVDSVAKQALWARIAGVGTEFPPAAIDALARIEATLDDPKYRAQRRYIGYLNGEPVASSALVLEAGVAGIYAVATVPPARGKGIGRAMTALPLMQARGLGYRAGILQASSMGRPIYVHMGFRDVCTYRLYIQS